MKQPEQIPYKILVKTNDNNNIIAANTDEFIKDPENWQEAGEQESRHFRTEIVNEYGTPLYDLIDGKLVSRETEDIEADNLIVIKAAKLTAVKALCGQYIIAKYPEWKQRNLLARITELNDKGTLSSTESEEKTSILAIWEWVKGIRAQSNIMESDIEVLSNADDIINYEIKFEE